jgi:hypothetical protein
MSRTKLFCLAWVVASTSPLSVTANTLTEGDEPIISQFANTGRMVVAHGEAFYDPSDGDSADIAEETAQPYFDSQPAVSVDFYAAPAPAPTYSANGWNAAPVTYADGTVVPAN